MVSNPLSFLALKWCFLAALELFPVILFLKTRKHFVLACASLGAFVMISWQKILWILGLVGHPPVSSIQSAIDAQVVCAVLSAGAYFCIVKRQEVSPKPSITRISDRKSFCLFLFFALVAIPGFVSSRFFIPYLSMLWIVVSFWAVSDGKWHWCAWFTMLLQTLFFFITARSLFYGLSCLVVFTLACLYIPSKKACFRILVLFGFLFLLQSQKNAYRSFVHETVAPRERKNLSLFPVPAGWQSLQYFHLKAEYNPFIPRSMMLLLQPVRLFNQSFYYEPAYPNFIVKMCMGFIGGLLRSGEDSLERVFFYTPRFVAYWSGETYRPLLYLLVPRLLWKDKPNTVIWNTFGTRYLYFVETEDPKTSVTFNYLSEGYMNFGYWGLGLAAVFFGAVLALVENWMLRVPKQFQIWFTVALGHWAFFPLEAYSLTVGLVHTVFILGMILLGDYFVRGLARLNQSDAGGFGFFQANPFL